MLLKEMEVHGMQMVAGGMKAEVALEYLKSRNGNRLLDPETEAELLEKIKHGKNKPIAEAVRDWILMTSNGIFSTSDLYIGLRLTSREQTKAACLALHRMCKEKPQLIEKYGTKAGHYRIINDDEEILDLTANPDPVLDLKWPLGIESLVEVSPKNIVVIAGVSNAGKTTFVINLIAMNYENYKFKYMSSEMTRSELIRLLEQYDLSLNEINKKVIWSARSWDQWDKIEPDMVNVIDYMEIDGEAPWKIRDNIRKVHEKLKSGIAVICLQKPPNRDMAFGGAGTMERARLYLAIDKDKATIVKSKQRADPNVNPIGMFTTYKVSYGHFYDQKPWQHPVEVI